MATPQSFFGGTSKKVQPDNSLNQVGHKSAGTSNTSNQRRDSGTGSFSLRPPITNQSNGGKGNNSQQVRNGNTAKFNRPNITGKVDNRKVGQ